MSANSLFEWSRGHQQGSWIVGEGKAVKKDYFGQSISMVGNWNSSLGKTLGNGKKTQVAMIPLKFKGAGFRAAGSGC